MSRKLLDIKNFVHWFFKDKINYIIFNLAALSVGYYIAFQVSDKMWIDEHFAFLIFVFLSTVLLTLIEFSFLFRKETMNYYLGRPTTLFDLVIKKLVAINIYSLGLTLITVVVFLIAGKDVYLGQIVAYHFEILYLQLFIVSFVVIGFLLTSSYLSGILTASVLYALPLIISFILRMVIDVLGHGLKGIPYTKLQSNFLEFVNDYFYRFNNSLGLKIRNFPAFLEVYKVDFIIFFIFSIVSYLTIRYLSKKRKNENNHIGIVFERVNVTLTTIVSFFIAMGVSTIVLQANGDIKFGLMVIGISLYYTLSYLIATVILNKNFHISKSTIRRFTKSFVLIIFVCFGFRLYLGTYKSIPELEEVDSVRVSSSGNYMMYYNQEFDHGVDITEQEDIERVYNLSEALAEKDFCYNNANMSFEFTLKSGRKVYREYVHKYYTSKCVNPLSSYLIDTQHQLAQDLLKKDYIVEQVARNYLGDVYSREYKQKSNIRYSIYLKKGYSVPYSDEFYQILMNELKQKIIEDENLLRMFEDGFYYYREMNADFIHLDIIYSEKIHNNLTIKIEDFPRTIEYIKENGRSSY